MGGEQLEKLEEGHLVRQAIFSQVSIKMGLKETGCKVVNWSQLALDRVQLWAHNNELLDLMKGEEFLD
jgi:hypothetical protein